MIVASLLLILVAVALLVLGLAGGSALLLVISIAASLLAAVALVVGARQAAAGRVAAHPARGMIRPPAGPTSGYGPPPAGPDIPVQHVPPSVDGAGTGWPPPPEPPSGADRRPRPAPGPGSDEVLTDEPPVQQVAPDDAAVVAGLLTPVRVVQGRPRYHLADCPHLRERLPSWLPVAEAVELGFTPCALCAPDTALLADAHRT